MKILLSAYACEPHKGSEPGVGWHWCMELAALEHEIWVITRTNNRENIERELSVLPPMPNLHFVYYDLPPWASWWKRGSRIVLVNVYYALWQWGAYCTAKKLCRQHRFDVIHHLTFGVFRQASLLGELGVPFVFGPAGGGERAPYRLRKHYSVRGHLLDLARDVMNALSRFDPLLWRMFGRAKFIYVKTPETGKMIPQRYQHKVRQLLEIGIHMKDRSPKAMEKQGFSEARSMQVLYVGNFFCLKGMQIGLRAFARLTAECPHVRLTMVGRGPEEASWRKLASNLGLADKMNWAGWLPQQALADIYKSHDVLLFPSLHDSSGNVLLEAMSHSLPVVCLGLGGPGVIVTNESGVVVPVENRSHDEVIEGLFLALKKLASDDSLLQRLATGAYQRAGYFSWERAVKTVYEADLKDPH